VSLSNCNMSRQTNAGMEMRTTSILAIRIFQDGRAIQSGRERNLKRT